MKGVSTPVTCLCDRNARLSSVVALAARITGSGSARLRHFSHVGWCCAGYLAAL